MTTLDTLAPLLDRLYADAERSTARLHARMAALPEAEVARLRADGTALYSALADTHLAVSRATGRRLYLLARATGARGIVEFGTSFGLSTLALAAALRDNGGGRLVTAELVPAKADAARATLREAGLADLVDVRTGDARVTLATELPDPVDLLVLDGHKPLYGTILAQVLPSLRVGGSVLADNAASAPEHLSAVRDPDGPFRSEAWPDDVEWSVRVR